MSRRRIVTARTWRDGQLHQIVVRGQTAKALEALVKAGPRGVTALEVSTWAYRLSAYCHDLIRKHGLSIVTQREDHPGGWHGRHVLLDAVEIVAHSPGSEVGI